MMGVMTNDRKRSPYPVEKETIIRKMESGREVPGRGVPERGSRTPTHTLKVGLKLDTGRTSLMVKETTMKEE